MLTHSELVFSDGTQANSARNRGSLPQPSRTDPRSPSRALPAGCSHRLDPLRPGVRPLLPPARTACQADAADGRAVVSPAHLQPLRRGGGAALHGESILAMVLWLRVLPA